MKKGKTAVIIIMVLAVAVGAWWFIWGKKKNDNPGEADQKTDPVQSAAPNAKPGAASANTGISPAAVDNSFPLATGSKGKYVKALQQLLKDKYKISLSVDGIFGPQTKEGLIRAFKIYSVENLAQFNSLFKK